MVEITSLDFKKLESNIFEAVLNNVPADTIVDVTKVMKKFHIEVHEENMESLIASGAVYKESELKESLRPGIPSFKLESSDGWLISEHEITSAISMLLADDNYYRARDADFLESFLDFLLSVMGRGARVE